MVLHIINFQKDSRDSILTLFFRLCEYMRIEQLKKNSITELALLTNILNDGLFRYFNMAYFKKPACSIAIGLQDTWGTPALKAERKKYVQRIRRIGK